LQEDNARSGELDEKRSAEETARRRLFRINGDFLTIIAFNILLITERVL